MASPWSSNPHTQLISVVMFAIINNLWPSKLITKCLSVVKRIIRTFINMTQTVYSRCAASITKKNPCLKSLLVNKDFLTWLLIGWQLCCQPIKSFVWKFLINNTNFWHEFFSVRWAYIVTQPRKMQSQEDIVEIVLIMTRMCWEENLYVQYPDCIFNQIRGNDICKFMTVKTDHT